MTETELKRLIWRSRRGILELDILLRPFAEQALSHLPDHQQRQYARLMDQQDADLFVWMTQQQTPQDPDLVDIINMILNHVQP